MAERATATIAIPAYNEAEAIGPVVTALAAAGPEALVAAIGTASAATSQSLLESILIVFIASLACPA